MRYLRPFLPWESQISLGNPSENGSALENPRFLCIVPLLRVSHVKDTNESVAQLVEQRTLNRSAPVERLEVEPHHMLEPPKSRQYAKA